LQINTELLLLKKQFSSSSETDLSGHVVEKYNDKEEREHEEKQPDKAGETENGEGDKYLKH